MNVFKSALATSRLTNILVGEKIAIPIREFLGVYHDQTGSPSMYSINEDREVKVGNITFKGKKIDSLLNFFSGAISCPLCTSVWVALFLVLLYYVNKKLFNIVVNTFAISEISTLLL